MPLAIYHNPACGTSRNTLALLHAAGHEPQVIEYLKSPPAPTEIRALAEQAGLTPRQLLRRRGTPYDAMGLDAPSFTDDALAQIAHQNPILINRPIVVSDGNAALCRPSDLVFDVVTAPKTRLLKDECVPILRSIRQPSDSLQDLKAVLAAEHLPVDDLAGPGCTFFAFSTLDGETVGYGGFELCGSAALVRSVVTLPPHRGTGIGRNIALILMRRAFDAGASDLYILTTTAQAFFGKLGFAAAERDIATPTAHATRQFANFSPRSASLLHRRSDP